MNISLLIILNSKWQILLQDRRSISKHWEDWWLFWWKIKKDETPEEALEREIFEELRLKNFIYEKVWYIEKKFKNWEIWKINIYLHISNNLSEKDFLVLEWDWAKFFYYEELKNLKYCISKKEELEIFDLAYNKFYKNKNDKKSRIKT